MRTRTEVVRDDDDTALVLLDRLRQRVNRRHVQMVRRLIEQEDVRVLHRELREHDPIATEKRAYHIGGNCQVAISPDGKTLATGTEEECIKIWDVEMLLGQVESETGYPFEILKAENPQLFDKCKYSYGWIIGPGNKRLLWIPLDNFDKNIALKRSEEHTSELSHSGESRMPSSA